MSEEEGVQVQAEVVEKPVMPTKAEIEEQKRTQAIIRKRAIQELADYKKRLRESNELKELQVKEFELNIAYFKNKKEWMDLGPELEALEAREQAIIAEQRKKKQMQLMEAEKNQREAKADTPKIILPKVGKPRK
jgi:hypothetical protein